jgi:hypothetical protein
MIKRVNCGEGMEGWSAEEREKGTRLEVRGRGERDDRWVVGN